VVLNVAQRAHLGRARDRFGDPNSNLFFIGLVKLAQAFENRRLVTQFIKRSLLFLFAHRRIDDLELRKPDDTFCATKRACDVSCAVVQQRLRFKTR
jgi:hypothetical protein